MYLNFSKFWRPGRCGSVVVLKGERLGNEGPVRGSGSTLDCDFLSQQVKNFPRLKNGSDRLRKGQLLHLLAQLTS